MVDEVEIVDIYGVTEKPKPIGVKAVALSESQFVGVAIEERSSSRVPEVVDEER